MVQLFQSAHEAVSTKGWKLGSLMSGGRSEADSTSEQGSRAGSASSSLVGSPAHSRKGINLLDNVVSFHI